MDTLNFKDTQALVTAAIKARTPIYVEGPPGVGKTAMASAIARELGRPLDVLILSQCDPTDVGGFPVVQPSGVVARYPLGAIKRACDRASVLFLDEATCAPPAVQATALRGVNEREFGDCQLHPDTAIILAGNPVDQAAGGAELSLPMLNRITKIKIQPDLREIQDYLYNLGDEGSTLRSEAVSYAATLENAPDLLAINPPAGAQSAGRPWASPRSIERSMRLCAQLLDDGVGRDSKLYAAALAGNLGEDTAGAFLSIYRLRANLPSIKEVKADPTAARLPGDLQTGIAVLGILAQVAQSDAPAAWVYADRLADGEIKVASFRILVRLPFEAKGAAPSKWRAQAAKARVRVMGQMGTALRGDE